MALKIALIDGYAFQPHDTLEPLDFENVIHHQEWRTVRQNFLDANAVKNHLMASMSVRKSMVETAGATLIRRAASTARTRSPGLQVADARLPRCRAMATGRTAHALELYAKHAPQQTRFTLCVR